jgi:hypothetical protein
MLICVDGTGVRDDTLYKERAKDGFVRTIFNTSRQPYNRYYRGPDWSGLGEKLTRPEIAVERIKDFMARGDNKIFMTGFSRGAAIVVNAAAVLKREGIAVEALFLFDAVDRSPHLDARRIPDNVKHAYHAVRAPEASSRGSFGNCATTMLGTGVFQKREFFTTHGAMGGIPWGEKGLAPVLSRIDAGLQHVNDSESVQRTFRSLGIISSTTGRPALLAERERVMQKGYIDEGSVDFDTKVTVAQEKQGMERIRAWMWGFLREHGVVYG